MSLSYHSLLCYLRVAIDVEKWSLFLDACNFLLGPRENYPHVHQERAHATINVQTPAVRNRFESLQQDISPQD